MRRHAGRIAFGVLLLSLHQVAEVAVPVAIGVVIDRAVATGSVPAMLWSVAGLAVLFTVLALAWRFGARQLVTAIERETHRVRVELAGRVLDPRGLRTGLKSGELLSIASSDAERAVLIMRAGSLAAAAVTGLVASSVALLAIDVPLGLGVLVGVPLLVVGLQLLSPLLTRRTADQQAELGRTTALATDLVAGLRTLRGIGAQHHAAVRYQKSSARALAATRRAAGAIGLQQGVTTAASGLFLTVVAGVAGWFALLGRLTVGELVAVVGLAQFVAEPVRVLGFATRIAATARASADRVASVLAAPFLVEPGELAAPAPADPRVELRAVTYRTLTDVSLCVRSGELLGVVADDQRDANALLELLSGRAPAADLTGEVQVDGAPVGDLSLAALRSRVLVEHHDVALFEGTLRSNLLAGAPPEATDAQLAEAMHTAAAEDLLDDRAAGLDTPVTDRGRSLSGGQRQRVGLARALLADPPVLVLHDPTTAIDAVTEERLAARLARARAGGLRATIVVTSSPALLGRMDRVVVVRNGKVDREGQHADLVGADTDYREAVLR
ncbi:ABC transporter ATP-binding protein [Actinophytocola sediminis]